MKKNKKILLLGTLGIIAVPIIATTVVSANYSDPLVTGTFDISEAQDNSLTATITQTGEDYFVEITGNGKINKSKWQELFFDSVWNTRNATRNVKRVNINKGVLFPDDSSDLFKSFVFAEINIYKGIKTSNITNMKSMFTNCQVANPDVEDWDVSNVTNFEYMFGKAYEATPQLSNWDTHSALNMKGMFGATKKANPDVSGWDVSNVRNFESMFGGTELADPQVGKWDTHSATNMCRMFADTEKANPDVSNWDVSNVQNFSGMFQWAIVAEPNVSGWDTHSATDMSIMFRYSEKADPDVSNWDVSNVSNFTEAFGWTKQANPDIHNWKLNDDANLSGIFWGVTNGHVDITKLDLSKFKNADAFRTPLSLRMTGAQLKEIYNRNQELGLITTTNNGIFIEEGDKDTLVKGFDTKKLEKAVVDSINIEDEAIYIIKPQTYNEHLNSAQKENIKNKMLEHRAFDDEINAAINAARKLDIAMKTYEERKKSILKEFLENKQNLPFFDDFNKYLDELEDESTSLLDQDNDSQEANKDKAYIDKQIKEIEELLAKFRSNAYGYLYSNYLPNLTYFQKEAIERKIRSDENSVTDINRLLEDARVLDKQTKILKSKEGILIDFENATDDEDLKKYKEKAEELRKEFNDFINYNPYSGKEFVDKSIDDLNNFSKEIDKLTENYKKDINKYIDSLSNLSDNDKAILKDKVNEANSIADIKNIKNLATKTDGIKPLLNEFTNDKKSEDAFKDFNKELDDLNKEIEDTVKNEANKENDDLFQSIDDLNDKINNNLLNDYKTATNNYIDSLEYLNKAQKDALKGKVTAAANKQAVDELFTKANVLNDSMKQLTDADSDILQEYIKDQNKYSDEFKKEVNDLDATVSQILNLSSETENTSNEDVQKQIQAINDLIVSYRKEAKKLIDTSDEFSDLNKAQKDALKDLIDKGQTKKEVDDILENAKQLNSKMVQLSEALNNDLQNIIDSKLAAESKKQKATDLKNEIENSKDTKNLSINDIDEYLKRINDLKNSEDTFYTIELKDSVDIKNILPSEVKKDYFVATPTLKDNQELIINYFTYDDKDGALQVIYTITNSPKNNVSKMFMGFKKYVEPINNSNATDEQKPAPDKNVNPSSDKLKNTKPETDSKPEKDLKPETDSELEKDLKPEKNNNPKETPSSDSKPIQKPNPVVPDDKKLKDVEKMDLKTKKIYQELLIANLIGVILSLGILLLVIKRMKKDK